MPRRIGLQNTSAAYLQRIKTPPTILLYMTLKQSDGWFFGEGVDFPLIAIAPRSNLAGVVALDKVLSIGQIELNSTYTKLNCLEYNF